MNRWCAIQGKLCTMKAFFSLLPVFLLSACGPSPVLPSATTPVPTPLVNFQPLTATPTRTTEPRVTVSATYTASPTATATEIPFPPEHYLRIAGGRQYFALGCEAKAAVDWAAYFDVEINEFNFQYELPLSDNPDKGFVGDVNGPWGQVPPYAYGVHAGPVAELLRQYGLPAASLRGMTVDQIKAELSQDQPVIAWVIGNMVGGIPATYTDPEGDTVLVAAYEHVVILTGYNETSIRYTTNGKFYDIPTEVFVNSWGVLGNMALIYEDD
jgi:uncharacterized protein YvpB